MARVLCVLYDDPREGHPARLCERHHTAYRALCRRTDHTVAHSDRLHARGTSGRRNGRPRPPQVPGSAWPFDDRSVGPGPVGVEVRPGIARGGNRHLSGLPAVCLTAERIAKAHKLRLVIVRRRRRRGYRPRCRAARRGITVAEITHSSSSQHRRVCGYADPFVGTQRRYVHSSRASDSPSASRITPSARMISRGCMSESLAPAASVLRY